MEVMIRVPNQTKKATKAKKVSVPRRFSTKVYQVDPMVAEQLHPTWCHKTTPST